MKVVLELRNVNGSMADVFTEDGVLISNFAFTSLPREFKENAEVPINKILKLKEAGFDSDEIVKMNEKGML